MAISTYTDLQSAIGRWLTRADLGAVIPDLITLAESYLNRELRLRVMETDVSLAIPDQGTSIPLPAGYVSPVGLWVDETYGQRPLRFMSSLQLIERTSSGNEFEWSIDGENIILARPTAGALNLTFRYVKSFTLSDDKPTNWLLTNHPDAYLFSALVEAAPVLRDTELLSIWNARRDRAVQEINEKEARSDAFATLTTRQACLPSERLQWGTGGYGRVG